MHLSERSTRIVIFYSHLWSCVSGSASSQEAGSATLFFYQFSFKRIVLKSVLLRQGFVDPVFVDHEDSQHAADLDTLVFDIGKHEQEVCANCWLIDVVDVYHVTIAAIGHRLLFFFDLWSMVIGCVIRRHCRLNLFIDWLKDWVTLRLFFLYIVSHLLTLIVYETIAWHLLFVWLL